MKEVSNLTNLHRILLFLLLYTLVESERDIYFLQLISFLSKSTLLNKVLKDENINFAQSCVYVQPPVSLTRTFRIKTLMINVFYSQGNKNTVYHFIRELIQEEEYAWFVNTEGRFRIKWEAAVERYIEYRAKKNPRFDISIDRNRASNSFREALLLRCYQDDGTKEYKECRKFSENNKVVEREFQLPSKVFHSLFGSREELASDQVI